jgi:hypothetical protein
MIAAIWAELHSTRHLGAIRSMSVSIVVLAAFSPNLIWHPWFMNLLMAESRSRIKPARCANAFSVACAADRQSFQLTTGVSKALLS